MICNRVMYLALTGVLFGTNAAPAMAAAPAMGSVSLTAGQKAAADLIHRYFNGYDRHDPSVVDTVFLADAGVVHADGKQTDNTELKKIIADQARDPHGRTTLGKFEFVESGPVMVVAFDRTTSGQDAGGRVIHKYRESWFLQRTGAAWRVFWANYVPYGTDDSTPGKTSPAAKSGDRPRLGGEKELAAEFVENFFKTFVRRDTQALDAMFLPHAKIVHNLAVEQSIGVFTKSLAEAPPETRKRPKPAPFDNFHFHKVGDFILIVFDNHVSHWAEGHPELEHTFRENWLLKSTPAGMKALWASYSLYGVKAPNLATKTK